MPAHTTTQQHRITHTLLPCLHTQQHNSIESHTRFCLACTHNNTIAYSYGHALRLYTLCLHAQSLPHLWHILHPSSWAVFEQAVHHTITHHFLTWGMYFVLPAGLCSSRPSTTQSLITSSPEACTWSFRLGCVGADRPPYNNLSLPHLRHVLRPSGWAVFEQVVHHTDGNTALLRPSVRLKQSTDLRAQTERVQN